MDLFINVLFPLLMFFFPLISYKQKAEKNLLFTVLFLKSWCSRKAYSEENRSVSSIFLLIKYSGGGFYVKLRYLGETSSVYGNILFCKMKLMNECQILLTNIFKGLSWVKSCLLSVNLMNELEVLGMLVVWSKGITLLILLTERKSIKMVALCSLYYNNI